MGGCVGKSAVGPETKEISLLLLGAPGVGKSTVFKQINKLYVSDFSDKYRQENGNLIRMAVVITVGAILKIGVATDENFPKDDADVQRVTELASKCDDPDVLAAAAHFESLEDCIARVTKIPSFQQAVHLLEQGVDPRLEEIPVPDSAI
jgi:energy-coupling factor transporter ATP-binding protein EcfA2